MSAAFRSDINGLRAWAVIAVIFYHFSIPLFNGGFVGVDVFFVISGFLMTGIITRGLMSDEKKFSVLHFYIARVRRILPALFVLCFLLLMAAYFLLGAIDFTSLALHVGSSLLFVSNIVYWLEAGYFDVDSFEKWLLHTWSLSVEWQFYLLLPLFLLLLWKIHPSKRCLSVGFIILTLLSLAFCIALTPLNSSAAFYWLPTRAWEMLVGGLVYLYFPQGVTSPILKKAFIYFGLLCIVVSILVFNHQTAWPGYYAVLPVIGSALVIISNQKSVFVQLPLLQWLGARSYSLYLWHWPVLVFLVYRQQQHEPVLIVLGLFVTLVLSECSYRFVENFTRNRFSAQKLKSLAFFLLPIFLLVVISAWIVDQQGLPKRVPEMVAEIEKELFNKNVRYLECHPTKGLQFKPCYYGEGTLKAIVVGDSHADALITAVASGQSVGSVVELSYGGCPTVRGVVLSGVGENFCDVFNEWALEQVRLMPAEIPLIIINRASYPIFSHHDAEGNSKNISSVHFKSERDLLRKDFLVKYKKALVETACEYAKLRPVYLMRPLPEMLVNVPRFYSRSVMRGDASDVTISKHSYVKRHAFIIDAQEQAVKQCGVRLLDPLPFLCDDDFCYGTRNGKPIYYDDDHLSESGNRLLEPLFKGIF